MDCPFQICQGTHPSLSYGLSHDTLHTTCLISNLSRNSMMVKRSQHLVGFFPQGALRSHTFLAIVGKTACIIGWCPPLWDVDLCPYFWYLIVIYSILQHDLIWFAFPKMSILHHPSARWAKVHRFVVSMTGFLDSLPHYLSFEIGWDCLAGAIS